MQYLSLHPCLATVLATPSCRSYSLPSPMPACSLPSLTTCLRTRACLCVRISLFVCCLCLWERCVPTPWIPAGPDPVHAGCSGGRVNYTAVLKQEYSTIFALSRSPCPPLSTLPCPPLSSLVQAGRLVHCLVHMALSSLVHGLNSLGHLVLRLSQLPPTHFFCPILVYENTNFASATVSEKKYYGHFGVDKVTLSGLAWPCPVWTRLDKVDKATLLALSTLSMLGKAGQGRLAPCPALSRRRDQRNTYSRPASWRAR